MDAGGNVGGDGAGFDLREELQKQYGKTSKDQGTTQSRLRVRRILKWEHECEVHRKMFAPRGERT